MKKSLLSLTVLASAVSGAATAAEIYKTDAGTINFYGQLRTEFKWLDIDNNNPTLSSGSSRTGIDGWYKLTDDLRVLGLVEASVDEDSEMYVRQHIFGLASNTYGTVKLGKQYTVSDDVYGADYSYFFGGSALRYGTLSGAEHDSLIKYEFDADNFWLRANYGLSTGQQDQELAELFIGTSIGDLKLHIGGGYNRANDYEVETLLPSETGIENMDIKNSYGEFTAEYNYGKGLLGFTYYFAQLENQEHSNIYINENAFTVGATYEWSEQGTAYLGYEYTMQDPSSKSNLKDDESGTLIYVGTDYALVKWAKVYVELGYADGTTLGYVSGGQGGGVADIAAQEVDSQVNLGVGARFYW